MEIDFATNQVTGQVQKTLPAVLRDAGFDRASFDFTTGGTLSITDRDKLVYNPAGYNWYSWSGTLPHFVAAGTDPTLDSQWIPRTDELLRAELANISGAGLVSGLGFLSPEMFSNNAAYTADYSAHIQAAITAAGVGPVKTVLLGRMYNSSPTNFDIPAGVSVIGAGEGTGIIFSTPPASAMHEFFTLAGSGSLLKDFSIKFNTGGLGSIGAVQAYGVWIKDTATNCVADGLAIDGKYSDSVMGFSNGFRLTGSDNVIKNCKVTHCSMGVTVRGTRLSVLDSIFDNGYTTEDGTAWTPSKPQWDGIACEGVIDCLISRNTCKNNGQSGIYIGGGGSGYSNGNIISDNRCFHNWNRGIDTGISGTQSATNDVTNISIIGNHVRDNRETQLWLYGTNNSRVIGNSIIETAEYDTLFAAQPSSSRAGLALGNSTWCINNVIEGNTISVQASTPFSLALNGGGHKIAASNRITGGASIYIFGTDAQRLYGSNVEAYRGTFTPSITAGTGVTVQSSSGKYSIKNGRITFDMTLTLTASSPSGSLEIGYLPGLGSATALDYMYSVDVYNGWNTSLGAASLRAIKGSSLDKIQIVRLLNGSYGYDAAAYAVTGCSIHISGYVETQPSFTGL